MTRKHNKLCPVCNAPIDPRSSFCRQHFARYSKSGAKSRTLQLTDKALRQMDGITAVRDVVVVPAWLISDK